VNGRKYLERVFSDLQLKQIKNGAFKPFSPPAGKGSRESSGTASHRNLTKTLNADLSHTFGLVAKQHWAIQSRPEIKLFNDPSEKSSNKTKQTLKIANSSSNNNLQIEASKRISKVREEADYRSDLTSEPGYFQNKLPSQKLG